MISNSTISQDGKSATLTVSIRAGGARSLYVLIATNAAGTSNVDAKTRLPACIHGENTLSNPRFRSECGSGSGRSVEFSGDRGLGTDPLGADTDGDWLPGRSGDAVWHGPAEPVELSVSYGIGGATRCDRTAPLDPEFGLARVRPADLVALISGSPSSHSEFAPRPRLAPRPTTISGLPFSILNSDFTLRPAPDLHDRRIALLPILNSTSPASWPTDRHDQAGRPFLDP